MAQMHINENKGWKFQWQEYEDDIIRLYYQSHGWEKVNELLPHRNKRGIQSRASKLGISYIVYNENYFEKIDTPEKAYWLGFIYTDGYVTTGNRWGIELGIQDKAHLENLMKDLDSNISIKERIRKNGTVSCQFQIKNKKMYDDLYDKGVIRNKTEVLEFPNTDVVGEELIPHFIRGLFDGDGSYLYHYRDQIRKDRGNKVYSRLSKQISFVCKSEKFIKTLKQTICESCGCEFNLNVNKTHNNLPTLTTSNAESMMKFINYIYSKDITRYLERKYLKIQEIKNCLA